MRKTTRSLMSSMLLFTVTLTATQNGYCDDASDTLSDIKTYLRNLGSDIGYDVTTPVTAPETTPTNTLLPSDSNAAQALEAIALHAFACYFGALPVNASLLDPNLKYFITSSSSVYTALNAFANATFPSYNSASNNSQNNTGSLSVNPLIDQPVSQQDPVNQAILNILGTPDYTYCMDSTATTWGTDCPYLYENKVMSNIIGTLPSIPFPDPSTSQPILSELNSNSLTGPLVYAVNPDTGASTSSSGSTTTNNTNAGLTASTQAEQAANFVRYASGMVVPLPLMSKSTYSRLLGQATNTSDQTDAGRTARETAQAKLTQYLAKVRIYAAQNSVAMSNMYYILSKRMPQQEAASSNGQSLNGSSQAMSEMTMATRRMYDPAAAQGGQQWITQINAASPATVQKEMAILLSEINYQLYLNRQQDERLLLTNSLLLIQNLSQNQPDRDASTSTAGQ